jgi:hypothetical protein
LRSLSESTNCASNSAFKTDHYKEEMAKVVGLVFRATYHQVLADFSNKVKAYYAIST